jgi:pyruvate/2-oxoglutarate dehydrogenase complex dihydrolipoamide acyltransferase (E2) component
MEFTLRAPCDGVVAEVHAPAGSSVALAAPVITVEPPDDDHDGPDGPDGSNGSADVEP